jgi:hypothetical protein
VKLLFIGLLLLAACQPTLTGSYAGETQNHLAIITQEQSCSPSSFDNSRCVTKWYCAVRFKVAKEGDVVQVPQSYCKTVLEEVK